ncbi:hypothetical protein, partial [Vibrio cholerae]|uniref:hypothetical protein n=1 Tax=Vibrio cholerae TaxID=666 RepID=UPI00301D87A0
KFQVDANLLIASLDISITTNNNKTNAIAKEKDNEDRQSDSFLINKDMQNPNNSASNSIINQNPRLLKCNPSESASILP